MTVPWSARTPRTPTVDGATSGSARPAAGTASRRRIADVMHADADEVRRRAGRRSTTWSTRALATALFLALDPGQPLLLEGEPGVGKTAAAKALARRWARR